MTGFTPIPWGESGQTWIIGVKVLNWTNVDGMNSFRAG